MRLCHSRMFYVRAHLREGREMVFNAHEKTYAIFGGACVRDHLKPLALLVRDLEVVFCPFCNAYRLTGTEAAPFLQTL